MRGDASRDIMDGGIGNDLMDGGTGNDSMEGGEGSDSMWGRDGNDFMFGDADNDQIFGGAGIDHITGGTNDPGDEGDVLGGGAGADAFYFVKGDSGGGTSVDVINDFGVGADLIVVQGNGATTFLGEQSGFSNSPGAEAYFQHIVDDDNGNVTSVFIRDANGVDADLEIALLGHIDLDQNDLFII